MTRDGYRAALCAVVLTLLAAVDGAAAQAPEAATKPAATDRYVRALQAVGLAPRHPWSLREFGPLEFAARAVAEDGHPWAGHRSRTPTRVGGGPTGPALRILPAQVSLVHNTAFPHANNDGAVWAGRGLTSAVEAGLALRWGPLSAQLAPIAYRAENAPFDLADTGLADLPYADPRHPTSIDRPQRFGDGAYARVEPGRSTVRLDLGIVAAGVTSSPEHWGPAVRYPVILGDNAPGFPRAFLGTSRPVDVWIGDLHGRVIWGRLESSPVAPEPAARYGSGLAAVLAPRGLTGLEIGLTRFIHRYWPEGGPSIGDLAVPFSGIFSNTTTNFADENQLASVFFRWVGAPAGFEVYGELGREDYNWDFRDLMLNPDHDMAYLAGVRRVSRLGADRLLSIGAEVVNAQVTHIDRSRPQTPFYRHSGVVEGHTHRGRLLGSLAVYGGSGAVVAADLYHPEGRVGLSWSRELRREGDVRHYETGRTDIDALDVAHEVRADALVLRGRWALTFALAGVYQFNRDLEGDAFNLRSDASVRWTP